jgi:hypothetical protein
MTMDDQLINSAALYFGEGAPPRVPSSWLFGAIDFFVSQNISLDYFDIYATEDFSPDETYPFLMHKDKLIMAVNKGLVESVSLYSNSDPNSPRSIWKAMASVEMENGMSFLGIEESRLPHHVLLLRLAYVIGGQALGVRYGVSYKRSLANGPDSYAAGVLQGNFADVEQWLISEDQHRNRLTAWRNEKYGSRRYLNGRFRGAYPASIISHEHVLGLESCAAFESVPGTITPLVENKLWIWGLTNSQIIQAEKMLHEGALLIE